MRKPLPEFIANLDGKSLRFLEVLERLAIRAVARATDRAYEANVRVMAVRKAMEAKRERAK